METEFTEKELESLVARLREVPGYEVPPSFTKNVMRRIALGEILKKTYIFTSVAACVIFAFSFSHVFIDSTVEKMASNQREDGFFYSAPASRYTQAYAVKLLASNPEKESEALTSAVDALVRTQGAEGGWENPTLTARNVAALSIASSLDVKGAKEAYRKGLRYLRKIGRVEMSAPEFAKAAKNDAIRLFEMGEEDIAEAVALASKM